MAPPGYTAETTLHHGNNHFYMLRHQDYLRDTDKVLPEFYTYPLDIRQPPSPCPAYCCHCCV